MGSSDELTIRTYEKGDAEQMAAVYNAAMNGQPGFQEDSAERLEQVYSAPTFDPASKQIAERGGRVVGYMTTTPNGVDPRRGNVNYPYLHPDTDDAVRQSLWDAGLAYLRQRGVAELGTAYFHTSWTGHLGFFEARRFQRRTVAYRVLEGSVPAAGAAAAAEAFTLRPAAADDFASLCELHRGALGDVPDPAPMQPEDFERFLAAPFTTEESLIVAERDGEVVGSMIAYTPPAGESNAAPQGMIQGPTLLEAGWEGPLAAALWARAMDCVRAAGAATVKSYTTDAATPQTDRLVAFQRQRGLTGDEVWVHFHREL